MSQQRVALGRQGEHLAAAYLRGQGMKISHLNYRVKRTEIDIIATDGDTLVFVEVRSRRDGDVFAAFDSVDAAKRRRVRKAVELFLLVTGRTPSTDVRIDVVAVAFDSRGAHIEHLRNAI